MKLLGFQFFQHEEMTAVKKTLYDELYQEMVIACTNVSRKGTYGIRLPRIPSGKDLHTNKAVEYFKVHLGWKRVKKCHWFGDKKYCYHTGKEITYEKSMAEERAKRCESV